VISFINKCIRHVVLNSISVQLLTLAHRLLRLMKRILQKGRFNAKHLSIMDSRENINIILLYN
jgi:hypothetical protein